MTMRKTKIKTGRADRQMTEHFNNLIRNRISVVLQMMYMKPDDLVDLESGEAYICSVCDIQHKRCEVEPDYRCELARKMETEFKELELALQRLKSGTYGYCERCSAFIGKKELEKALTRTYCDACGKKN